MHELSIADAIVRIACDAGGGRRVTLVEVKVGHLRQVVPDALAFAFDLVAQGTAAEGAELVLEPVPVAACCRDCGAESAPSELPLRCAACGGLDLDLLRGEELLVDAVEVEEPLITTGGRNRGD
jgi:hydrogenase nickel incorporation protein HypA/HybF